MTTVETQQTGMWYAIEVKNTSGTTDQLDRWCTEHLGQGITGIKDFPDVSRFGPDEGRWGLIFGRIFFRYREDMLMFALRWT